MFQTTPAVSRFFLKWFCRSYKLPQLCLMIISRWLLMQLTWEVSFMDNGVPNSLKDWNDKLSSQSKTHSSNLKETAHTPELH